jgi:hypothetical protein
MCKTPLETRVSEMETEAAALTPITMNSIPELRTLLGLGDDVEPLDVLKAAISQIRNAGKSLRDTLLNSVLDKKLKGGDDAQAKLVRRMIASEMQNSDLKLTGDDEKDEKTVSEMVDTLINSNDDVKEIVSEMIAAPPAPPVTGKERNGEARELKVGYKSPTIRVRSAQR